MPTISPVQSDAELLDAIRRSPQSADRTIGYLLDDRVLRNKAFAALNRYFLETEDAEAAFGEALVAFMLSVLKGTFRGEASIHTYIVSICHNLGKKAIRKRSNTDFKPPEELEQLLEETTDPPDVALETEETDEQISLLLKRYLEKLPKKCAKSLRWFYYDNWSVQQIATQEQVQKQGIKNRLQNCRDRLRQLLNNDPEALEIIRERILRTWKK